MTVCARLPSPVVGLTGRIASGEFIVSEGLAAHVTDADCARNEAQHDNAEREARADRVVRSDRTLANLAATVDLPAAATRGGACGVSAPPIS